MIHNLRSCGTAPFRTLNSLLAGVLFLPLVDVSAQDAVLVVSVQPEPDPANLRAFVEMARSDIRTQKAYVLSQNLELTEDEAFVFWPIHREYDLKLNELLDERYELVKRFAQDYGSMSDDQAERLAKDVLDFEKERNQLKAKYFGKFKKAIPALKAAQWLQLENRLQLVIDLQVAGALPIIK